MPPWIGFVNPWSPAYGPGRRSWLLLLNTTLWVACETSPPPTQHLRLDRLVELQPAESIMVMGGLDLADVITWWGDSAIVVVDRSTTTVRVLRRDGALTRAFGGAGSGPGEFKRPVSAAAAARGPLVVADAELHRVTAFDRSGIVQWQAVIPGTPLRLLAVDTAARAWVAWITEYGSGVGVGTVGPTGRVSTLLDPETARRLGLGDAALLPGAPLAVAVHGRRLTVADPYSYRLTTLNERGMPELVLERNDVAVDLFDADDARRMVRALAGQRTPSGTPITEEALLRRFGGRPRPHFLASQLMIDQVGRAWTLTTRGTDSTSVIDILDPRGSRMQSVTLRVPIRSWSVQLPWLAILTDDRGESGPTWVRVFKVVEAASYPASQ